MNSKIVPSQPGQFAQKTLSYEEQFALFKHFDESAHKKESLFLGVSLAIVPAVYVSWERLAIFPLILAAISSIGCYWLHGIHIARYGASQDAIRDALSKLRSDFLSVFTPPDSISIRKTRLQLRWGMVTFWVIVCVAKITG